MANGNMKAEQSVDCTVDAGRRNALRKIAVGVGVLAGYSILPEQWTRPIIGQIVLPAHAATSGSVLHDPCTVTLLEGDESSDTVKVRVDGYVTPPAADLPVWIFANANADIGAVELETKTDAEGNYTLTFDISGGPGLTSVSVETRTRGAEGVAHCAVHFSQGVSGNFLGNVTSLNQVGTNSPPNKIGEALAEIGDALADLIVSNAQADVIATLITCVTLAGNTAHVFIQSTSPGYEGSGSIHDIIEIPTGGGDPYFLTFLSISQDKLQVRITMASYVFEGWLYPSSETCPVNPN